MRKLCTVLYVLQRLTLDRIQIHNSYEPLWEKKGTKLNKCLCKANVRGVVMVTVLIRVSQNVCSRTRPVWWRGFMRIVLTKLRGFCNGVVMEFRSSVCLFDQICRYRNPRLELLRLYVTSNSITTYCILYCLVSFAKCLTTFITCPDNTSLKSARNKPEEKKCKCAAVH